MANVGKGVALIVIPSGLNAALSLKDLLGLAEEFESAAIDPDIAVIVMSGPPGTFCAGGDIADFLRCGDLDELESVVKRFFRALIGGEKPMIAAVDGPAIGLGMTMLLHFDAVYASPTSSFVAPFGDLGLVPEAASTLLAPTRFGHLRAFDLLCNGRSLSAQQAMNIGLVTDVTNPDDVLEQSLAVARRLTRKPRAALFATRRLLRGDRDEVARRIDAETQQFRSQLEDAATARRLGRLSKRIQIQAVAA
ncbi:enoyl-CoA hydratase-related protein [Methylopila sp. M107]|uniref:enoyl-CoA hydratase-related protein n=1 Tax=Methylopila sp. M107 TaxID=1101190 RepID=UPI00036305E4|nr:enoyl-CoA hydratase-related protein [Methylopila sp. M107]